MGISANSYNTLVLTAFVTAILAAVWWWVQR